MKTTKKKQKTVLAWHWCRADMKTQYSNEPIIKGGTLNASGPLQLCKNGMHASICPLDGLQYAPGSTLCRVEMSGNIVKGDDKVCAKSRTVLWHINADKLLYEFACLCAERSLKRRNVEVERCWNAIKTKRLWLEGKATDAQLAAAWGAAWDAALGAARGAAWGAARAAAWDAALAAARGAAWDAALGAAWGAAWAAEKDWQRDTLNRMITEQAEREGYHVNAR